MDIKDGLLGRVPFVTVALALAMGICFATQLLGGAENGGRQEETLLRAQSFFEQNTGLDVDARQRSLLGAAFVEEVRAAHAERGAAPVFSERIQRRTQARFDTFCDEAMDARMKEDPAWRHGITGPDVPVHRYLTYAFFHPGWIAFGVTLVFLLLAGLGLETTWGAVFFAPISLLSIVAGGLVFAHADAAGQVPLSGGGPLVAALLGAYVVRGAGGNLPLPGVLLLGVWLFVDALFVRGIWIENVADWPWLTLGLSLALGAGLAAGIRFMGIDAKLVDVAETLADGRHPAIAEAERCSILGRGEDAFTVLAEAVAAKPGDATLALAWWEAAIEVGRAGEAVQAILPVMQSELRSGDLELATRHWRQVMATGVPVRVSTTVLVRMGEALLDAGEPEEALDNLRRALDAPGTMGSALAQRVVRIARDLDPVLTARAAEVALRDPQIEAATRADLETLAGGGIPSGSGAAPRNTAAARPASGVGPASPAASGTTAALAELAEPEAFASDPTLGLDSLDGLADDLADDIEASLDDGGIDLDHIGDLTSPEEFADLEAGRASAPMELDVPGTVSREPIEHDPNALSIHSLERELASGLIDEPDESVTDAVAAWDDPGLVEDLSNELDSGPPSLIAESDLDAPLVDNSFLDAGALSAEALAGPPDLDAPGDAGGFADPLAYGALSEDALTADALDDGLGSMHAPSHDGLSMDALAAEATVTDGASRGARADDLLGHGTLRADAFSQDATDPLQMPPPLRPTPAPSGHTPSPPPPTPAPSGHTPSPPRKAEVAASPASTSLRALKVLDAVPLALEHDALKFDVAGRGKTRLPFERIEAVAVAAVSGLSAKPVLVIDFVLNWSGGVNEPLKVIRTRSDGFNPVALVGAGGSPLDSIKTLIRRVLDGAQATPLPDAGAAVGTPFSMQPDLESYQRDVLMAT